MFICGYQWTKNSQNINSGGIFHFGNSDYEKMLSKNSSKKYCCRVSWWNVFVLCHELYWKDIKYNKYFSESYKHDDLWPEFKCGRRKAKK